MSLAALLLAGCAANAPAPTATPTDDPGVDVVDLSVGMCILDAPTGSSVTTVEVVPCTRSHDAEVFASILLADGPFPGQEAVGKASLDQCAAQFAHFVGVPFASSALTYEYYAPSAETWNAGDRAVLCLVRDPAGPVTGSLQGVAR